jgi:serine protease Do
VMDITPDLRSQFQIPRNIRGALITNVEPDSPSYAAGLRPGQVILEIDRQPVTDADDAVRLGRGAQEDSVLLRVWTAEGSRYVPVKNTKAQP